jgi:hypothetical protein
VLILLLVWAFMLAALVAMIRTAPSRPLVWWALVAAIFCGLGTLAIARQPIGQPTAWGRLGSGVVHWGWRAGRGKLWPPVVISWVIWVLVGLAAVGLVRHRDDGFHQVLILAWAVEVAALFYILGLGLSKQFSTGFLPPSLLGIAGSLILMVGASAWLASTGTPAAKRLALMVAGGPPLIIAVTYGLFLLVTLAVGRGRWN